MFLGGGRGSSTAPPRASYQGRVTLTHVQFNHVGVTTKTGDEPEIQKNLKGGEKEESFGCLAERELGCQKSEGCYGWNWLHHHHCRFDFAIQKEP